MKPVLSRAQSRDLDRRAMDVCGVPGISLMENAGRGAAEAIVAMCVEQTRVVIVCGAGNNAGDGYVIARRLLTARDPSRVFSLIEPERLRGDAKANYDALTGLSQSVVLCDSEEALSQLQAELAALGEADILVDAIFGTGLDRNIEGHFARAIVLMNDCLARRVALDIPSGVCADTGAVLGTALNADVTTTFAQHKLGLCTSQGARHAGQVHLVDIGIPAEVARAVGFDAELVEELDAAEWFQPRTPDVHKRSAGHVLCFAGSRGTSGAALLCAQGALRGGAGLVTLAGFSDTLSVLEPRVLEAMTANIDETALEASLDSLLARVDSVVIGPGFGLDARAEKVVEHVLGSAQCPIIVDADALTCLVPRLSELKAREAALVMTPHPGELGRMLGATSAAVEANRFEAVTRAAELTGAVVLLKGPYTLIAKVGQRTWINDGASPVLATAGSGDVLSGVIGALACGHEPRRAAALGAFVHARSGRNWQLTTGADRGMLAREIADGVPAVFAELARSGHALPD